MRTQHVEKFTKPVNVHIQYGRPDKRRRDLLNYDKALCDFLVTIGALEDDHLIHKAVLEWSDDVHGVQIEVEER